MTREELLELVSGIIFHHELEGVDDPKDTAALILDAIYKSIFVPTKEMIESCYTEDDFVIDPFESWQAMIELSALAKVKEIDDD